MEATVALGECLNLRGLAAQSNYRPTRLAELCRLSLRHVERRLKVEVGTTPRLWLKQERLRSALTLLLDAQSAKEVAYSLGYRQCSQFCREFKLGFGLTPTQFRRSPKCEQNRLLGITRAGSGMPGRLA
jgi:AraC-like DNA-binding protein